MPAFAVNGGIVLLINVEETVLESVIARNDGKALEIAL